MIKKFTQLVATIAVTATVSIAGVTMTSSSAHAQQFNRVDCIDATAKIAPGLGSVFMSILDRNQIGFCSDDKETRADYNDRIIKEMWGYCVINRGTNLERGRLQNGENNPDEGANMYPYGGRGGSLKNRRVSANYADDLLRRVTNNYAFFFRKSTDTVLTQAGRRIDLAQIGQACGIPR